MPKKKKNTVKCGFPKGQENELFIYLFLFFRILNILTYTKRGEKILKKLTMIYNGPTRIRLSRKIHMDI